MALREKLANMRFLSNATQNYILDHQCQVQRRPSFNPGGVHVINEEEKIPDLVRGMDLLLNEKTHTVSRHSPGSLIEARSDRSHSFFRCFMYVVD